MSIEFRMSGIGRVSKQILGKGKALRSAMEEAVDSEGTAILEDAKANYVPIDTTVLRESGSVESVAQLGILGGFAQSTISFGGPGIPYAAAIHEHLSRSSPLESYIRAVS